MASISVSREDLFPNGTTVSAYEIIETRTPTSGAPSGSVVDSGVVSGGSVTLTGLSESTGYWLYAGSPDRYLRVFVPVSETAQSGSGAATVTPIAASGASRTLTAPAAGGEAAYDVTLTANCTFTLAATAAGVASYLTVKLKQGGSGSYTATWLGAISWPNQTPPLLSTTVDVADVITLFTFDGGTTWNGVHAVHALQQPSAPAAPTGLAGVVTANVPNLGWNAPTNNGGSTITGYKVYRGTSSGAETLLATIGNVTTYADSSAVAGTQYWYKVAAINAIGTGTQSSEITLGGGPTAFVRLTSPAAGLLTAATPEVGAAFVRHPASTGTAGAIVSSAHRVRSGDANATYWISPTAPPSADYTVGVDVTLLGSSYWGYEGVVARWDATAETGYMLRNDAGTVWQLYRYVTGTPVQLAAPVACTGLFNTPYRLELKTTGTNIAGFLDGVQIFNVTDSTISAAGKAGMFFYQLGNGTDEGELSNFLAAA